MRHIFTSDKRESYHNITKHTVKETKRELLPLNKRELQQTEKCRNSTLCLAVFFWLKRIPIENFL